jgi:hypothetical protein
VSVGTDHDTAAFAVATLRRWWHQAGRALYPTATRLLVCADAGGSNGYRVRAWKTELARLAAETGPGDHRLPLPPGTSKWNKVEHRLFSHISMNWRGRPLVSHEVIVELIAATQTRSGLKVRGELDRRSYPLGVKISDRDLAAVPLHHHGRHGEWNYTVLPAAASPYPQSNQACRAGDPLLAVGRSHPEPAAALELYDAPGCPARILLETGRGRRLDDGQGRCQ